jgi:hypothetical protein
MLNDSASVALIDDVVLIDGLHASYVPDRVVLADGGRIEGSVSDRMSAAACPAGEAQSDVRSRFHRERSSHSNHPPVGAGWRSGKRQLSGV